MLLDSLRPKQASSLLETLLDTGNAGTPPAEKKAFYFSSYDDDDIWVLTNGEHKGKPVVVTKFHRNLERTEEFKDNEKTTRRVDNQTVDYHLYHDKDVTGQTTSPDADLKSVYGDERTELIGSAKKRYKIAEDQTDAGDWEKVARYGCEGVTPKSAKFYGDPGCVVKCVGGEHHGVTGTLVKTKEIEDETKEREADGTWVERTKRTVTHTIDVEGRDEPIVLSDNGLIERCFDEDVPVREGTTSDNGRIYEVSDEDTKEAGAQDDESQVMKKLADIGLAMYGLTRRLANGDQGLNTVIEAYKKAESEAQAASDE